MQVVRKVTNVLCQRGRTQVKRSQILLQVLAYAQLVHSMLETAEGDRQSGQLLAHVVMQITRDARALCILGLDQPSRQLLDLSMAHLESRPALESHVFSVLTFGDVDIAADVTRETAIQRILWN